MDDNKRATVMVLHGSSDDKLRQALAQGLVNDEVQQSIEETLKEADDARVYAGTMQRKLERQRDTIEDLRNQVAELEHKRAEDEAFYRKAVAAYNREEKRLAEKADRKEVFGIAALGALAFIAANLIGRFVFGVLIK